MLVQLIKVITFFRITTEINTSKVFYKNFWISFVTLTEENFFFYKNIGRKLWNLVIYLSECKIC